MNDRNSIIYSEIYSILDAMKEEDVKRIPKKCLELIAKKKSDTYSPKYDLKRPLKDQNIKQETLAFLAFLYLNYWCDSEDEKNNLIVQFNENEMRYQEQLREKYNPDNIFKKQKIIDSGTIKKEESLVIVEKKNFILILFAKIKNLLKRKNRIAK